MSRPVPERFLVAKGTLRFDRLMTAAIKVGGFGIIVAVFGICFYILSVVLPLFNGASIQPAKQLEGVGPTRILGLDDYSKLPYLYNGGSEITLIDVSEKSPPRKVPVAIQAGLRISAMKSHPGEKVIVLGTEDGQVGSLAIRYTGTAETLDATAEVGSFNKIGEGKVVEVDYGGEGEEKLFAATLESADGNRSLRVLLLEQKRSLLGKGKLQEVARLDLTDKLTGPPGKLLVPTSGDGVIVQTGPNQLDYFFRRGETMELRQEFAPFADASNKGIHEMAFLFGDVSLIIANTSGEMRLWSLNVAPGGETRLFAQTKTFSKLPGPPEFFAIRHDKKSFLTSSGNTLSLRHATTESVRFEESMDFAAVQGVVDSKSENIALMDKAGRLKLCSLNDPHPEAGVRAFLGKIWYEGYTEPKYEWQSTSGTQDFEPKLSLMPLIFGTFKGTVWAMLFAVPIALLAAIYTSQFLSPGVKRIVKPAMEIMASLPSVVLGFLAALWLAPILEHRVPSIMLVIIIVPLAAILLGWAWAGLPVGMRNRLPSGTEWIVFIPIMLLLSWWSWQLGPALEDRCFGGDFPHWWPQFAGSSFDQRNSLVVGFMMGFAVIPIIFTIAEDALSSVPPSLTAASAALGASRWQVVQTVVLPVASAGIFSALMVGLGRAVGETMIVVMATGNTPIMEWNIFNGMRTLSANIAVELPEASVGSTHYRTLFLGALVLFLLTFAINTVAELLRQRLREKYKIV